MELAMKLSHLQKLFHHQSRNLTCHCPGAWQLLVGLVCSSPPLITCMCRCMQWLIDQSEIKELGAILYGLTQIYGMPTAYRRSDLQILNPMVFSSTPQSNSAPQCRGPC